MSTDTQTTEPTGISKVSANFLPSSIASLDIAAEATGDTKTDVINRAVQLYAVAVTAAPGQVVEFDFKPGVFRSLTVRDVPPPLGLWARVGSLFSRMGGGW